MAAFDLFYERTSTRRCGYEFDRQNPFQQTPAFTTAEGCQVPFSLPLSGFDVLRSVRLHPVFPE